MTESDHPSGGQLIAELLAAYDVSHIFLVPIILNRALYEMEQRTEISRIVVHSEKAAAYMADGYARASGRVGVCMAQAVGAANLAAGLRDAAMACAPIVAITGGPKTGDIYRHRYQEVADRIMFSPVTKRSTRIDAFEHLVPTVRQAFRDATSDRPGPVHIELAGHFGEVIEEGSGVVDNVAETEFSRVPPFRPRPADVEVGRALGLLQKAKRPVIVAGGGVRLSGARLQLQTLAEALGIPVATSLSGKDVIPSTHPLAVGVIGLYCRPSANRIVAEADVVFFIGTKTGSQVTNDWSIISESAECIQADIVAEDLGRNYRNSVSLLGDARSICDQMLAVLEDDSARLDERVEWLNVVSQMSSEWLSEVEGYRSSAATPIRPERLCRDLSAALPENSIVVADTGHAGMWAASHITLTSPNQMFLRSAGSLGWALPAAIGAQCAFPDRPVVCFTGDGGLWYHIAELETMARWNIPATIVVNNNNAFSQEIELWEKAYGGRLHGRHAEMWQFRPTNFSRIASEMGLGAQRVEDPASLFEALSLGMNSGRPNIVEVITDIAATAPSANT